MCHLLHSTVLNDLPVKVLGFHTSLADVLFKKISVTLKELETRSPEEIVMFVDAYDVVITAGEKEIVDKFLSFHSPIVFSAEAGCWPFMDGRKGGQQICDNVYPPSVTPYRFLNSGAWIGYVGAARSAFQAMMRLPEAEAKAIDQELASIVFLKNNSGIVLDYNSDIFQSVHMSQSHLRLELDPKGSTSRWRNTITKTLPAVFHFNGGAKNHQSRIETGFGHDIDDHSFLPKGRASKRITGVDFDLLCATPSA